MLNRTHLRDFIINFKKISPYSILNKEIREFEYTKGFYKKKVQAEINSYKDYEDEDKRDNFRAQDLLMLERISF